MTTNTDKLAAHMALVRGYASEREHGNTVGADLEAFKAVEASALALFEAAERAQQAEPVAFVDERAISWIAAQTRAKTAHITTKLSKEKSFERPLALFLAAPAERAPAPPVAELVGYMNPGHVHELQQKRMPYGYVYPDEAVGAGIPAYLAASAKQEQNNG